MDLKFDLYDNISWAGEDCKKEYILKIDHFLKGYQQVSLQKGNTYLYILNNIDNYLIHGALCGEALYFLIKRIEENSLSINIRKILREIYTYSFVSLPPTFHSNDKELRMLDTFDINGQDYFVIKLIEHGESATVYNSLVKFLLAYSKWRSKEEIKEKQYFINNEVEEEDGFTSESSEIDEDLMYWIDVNDGENPGNGLPPSDRITADDFYTDTHYTHEVIGFVKNIMNRYLKIVMDAKQFSINDKMKLVDLYSKSVNRVNLNSSLIFNILNFISKEIQVELSYRINIDNLYFPMENHFFKDTSTLNFHVGNLDLSELHVDCNYYIGVKFEEEKVHSIYVKRSDVDTESEYFQKYVREEFVNKSLGVFIEELYNDIFKHSSIKRQNHSSATWKVFCEKNPKYAPKASVIAERDDLPF